MKYKRVCTGFLACCLCLLFAGCGQAPVELPQAEAPAAPGDAQGELPYAGVELTWTMVPSTDITETEELIALVREKTGIIIHKNIVEETKDDEMEKALVNLLAGDEMDILYYALPRLKPFMQAGVLMPLDELAAGAGYPMQAIYGEYLPRQEGKTWALPAFTDIWLTLYNRDVFDDAGIPYPQASGWTWEAYLETAKRLTDPAKGVYGSLMLDYDCYNYMLATQHGRAHYTDEGLCNYADPAFADSLHFFYGLGNTHKVQPAMDEFVAGNVVWDDFFSQTTQYGMFVCGGWTMQLMADDENYPRDWRFGVLPMPYPEGETPSTLTVTGCYAIPATSKNPEAALAAIACMAEYQYTLGYGRIPARRDLSAGEINDYIEQELVAPYAADGVTAEDIRAAWFEAGRVAYPEKVMGPADTEINAIWVEEGREYGLGKKSLEEAMHSIRQRADEAIGKVE